MTPARTPNPIHALSSAEDDYREEVTAFYEVAPRLLEHDLLVFEQQAADTLAFAERTQERLNRLEYGAREQKHRFLEYLLDQVDEALDHGGGSVVRAHVKMMESKL